MTFKIYQSSLLLMLLWLIGGTRPVKAKLISPVLCQSPGEKLNILDKVSFEHLVNESSNIFEGVLTSRGLPDRHSTFGVTLKVRKSYKGHTQHLSHIRLRFAVPGTLNNTSKCVVEAALEPGRRYIFFTKESRNRQFLPLATPVPRLRSVIKELRKHTCKTCRKQEPKLKKIRDVQTNEGSKFKLQCSLRSRSQNSKIIFDWFQNSELITPDRRRRIKNKHFHKRGRHRSLLRVRRVNVNDSGPYACRVSIDGQVLKTTAVVTVVPLEPKLQGEPLEQGQLCPVDSYCLNGGTCVYYASIGELSCICSTGYKGKRCEEKDVYDNGMIWGHRVSRCVLGQTHYPC